MEHQIKKEPQFWINPNFRLNSPHFRFAWFKADMTVLRQEAMIMSVERKVYQTSTQCVVCVITPDHSSLDIVYADKTKFASYTFARTGKEKQSVWQQSVRQEAPWQHYGMLQCI